MIRYIKEQIEELLTKDEIARIIKVYADEIKHPIEETAIRNYDGCVKQGYFESDEDDE